MEDLLGLCARDTDLAVEDEERRAADAELARNIVLLLRNRELGLVGEDLRSALLREAMLRREIDEHRGIRDVLRLEEVCLEQCLRERALRAERDRVPQQRV